MPHYDIRVEGRVQGVWFRQSTLEKASELNLNGIVKNEPDRSVYIEAEGDYKAIEQLFLWCLDGPRMADVVDVQMTRGAMKNYSGFRIVR